MSRRIISLNYLFCIPFLTFFHLACCPHHVWTTLLLPPNLPFGVNPVDDRRILPRSKKCSFPAPIFINRWLLNLIFSMTKALNGQNSSKQGSQPPSPPFNAIWKTLLQLLLAFLFTPYLFISKFLSFFWPHSSCDCIAYELIQYNQLQVSGISTNFRFKLYSQGQL